VKAKVGVKEKIGFGRDLERGEQKRLWREATRAKQER